MTVKIQKEIRFINECGCIVVEKDLAAAILWYQNRPTLSEKKIYMHGRYPAVSIGDVKIHVHRLLMQYWLGIKLPFNASVHHLNENKLDARKENLSIFINSAHNSNHNKGKVLDKEHKRKISEANKNRKGMKMKKKHNIPTYQLKDLLNFGFSINYIASLYKCNWSTIKSNIHENKELLEGE
ncbi:hypothetical protein [Brochothrix thermosphacta]|uniref:hypothetical protein n=1 Tax=Brochothrix thermosphacta TaxID=2756 RepID=UPI0039AF5A17